MEADDGDFDEDFAVADTEVIPEVVVPGDPLDVLYRHHPETILDYAEAIEPLIQLKEVVLYPTPSACPLSLHQGL
jgi:hypothetical protein